jgi:ADP-ribosylglycohydrolase
MREKQNIFRGCLLGLAVGDAMGYTVDSKCLAEICEDYGPNGLLGYDLVNGYAEVTSYTQLAAFAANGLMLGLTRGRLRGIMAPPVRYIALAIREWSRSQHYCQPEKNHCWLSTVSELKRRRCMDTWMLSTLSRDPLGTMEEPVNRSDHPAALTEVIPIAMLAGDLGLSPEETVRLGAEAVALTYGDPDAFLSAAALTYAMSRIVSDKAVTPEALARETLNAIQLQFGREYAQTTKLWELAQMAITLAESDEISQMEAMERLGCRTAPEVLAGVLYACITCRGDFDTAMITAVNHSGRSAAVGAITGAILGARMGEEALPEFYLECLEPVDILRSLADDLWTGCPMEMGGRLFDMDWDRKYLHGGK